MSIHNDLLALERERKVLAQQLEILTKVKEGLMKELQQLYQSGFRDRKFEELKTRVNESSEDLKRAEKMVKTCCDALEARAGIIKAYYSVDL